MKTVEITFKSGAQVSFPVEELSVGVARRSLSWKSPDRAARRAVMINLDEVVAVVLVDPEGV